MTNENDLIRRGDAMREVTLWLDNYDAMLTRILAIPAVTASQPADPVVKADSCQRVTVKPAKTAKGNNPPASVWVTLHSLKPDGGETFIFSVTDHPWDDDCDASITKWADNLEYVLKGTTIDTQPDPRDAVIARLVKAIENANDYDPYCECVSCTELTLAIAATKGGAA